jgi:hypothetical protein
MSKKIEIGVEAVNTKDRAITLRLTDGTRVKFGPFFVFYYEQMLALHYRQRIELMGLNDFDLWLYHEERCNFAAEIIESALKAKWVDGIENKALLFGNAQDNNYRFGVPFPLGTVAKRLRALTLPAAAAKAILKWFLDDIECRPWDAKATDVREKMKLFLKNA